MLNLYFIDILLLKLFYIKFKEKMKLNCIKMFYVFVRVNFLIIFELFCFIIYRCIDSEYECSGIYLIFVMYVFMEFYL